MRVPSITKRNVILTFRLHERAFHNLKVRPDDVRATPQLMHLALSSPSLSKKRHEQRHEQRHETLTHR